MSCDKKTSPSPADGGTPAACTTGPCPAPCPPPDPWLRDALAVMCPKDKALLDDLRARGVTITAFDRIYYEDPFFDVPNGRPSTLRATAGPSGTDMNIVIKSVDSKGVLHDILLSRWPKASTTKVCIPVNRHRCRGRKRNTMHIQKVSSGRSITDYLDARDFAQKTPKAIRFPTRRRSVSLWIRNTPSQWIA